MIRRLIYILFALLPFIVQAQDTIHIFGNTIAEDGDILIGAQVIAYDSAGHKLPYKAISDVDGNFELSIPLSARVSYLAAISICFSDTVYLTNQLFQSYTIAVTKPLYPNCGENVITISYQTPQK